MPAGTAAALRVKTALLAGGLHAAARDLWSSPHDGYAEYLCTMHAVIRASVPVMRAAAGRLEAGPPDALAVPLARYLRRHAAEERGHEEWIREDLAALGADPDEPLRRVPPPSVAALVGAQYYWIFHYHPACLLGYIHVLEGDPMPAADIGAIAARAGHPAGAFRTLYRHSRLDPGHGDELDRLIDALPLDARLTAAIGLSALHTVGRMTFVLREITARAAR